MKKTKWISEECTESGSGCRGCYSRRCGWYICPNCRTISYEKENICPNCGLDMRLEE